MLQKMQHHNVTSTQCKYGIYYGCIFRRHTDVPSDIGILQKRTPFNHITLTRNSVIQFYIQNTHTAPPISGSF